MQKKQSIVVAVDFSTQSRNALAQGLRLAKASGGIVHVLHVIESLALDDLAKALGGEAERIGSKTISRALVRMRKLVADSEPGETQILFEVLVGSPYKKIVDVVHKRKAELLILGSRGLSCFHPGASTLASRCIRHMSTEILIVRKEHTAPFKEIGVFIDLPKLSIHTAQRAIDIAKAEGARLHVYHVYLPPWKIVHHMSPTIIPSDEQKTDHRQEIIEEIQSIFLPLHSEAGELEIEYSLIESSEKIVGMDEFIEKSNVDLVIVNTKQHSGLFSALLRTVSEHIILTSPCSVLTIKSDA